jgi:hypothetical protein
MAFCQEVRFRPPESSSRRASDVNTPREALPISAFAWGGPHIFARLGTPRWSRAEGA